MAGSYISSSSGNKHHLPNEHYQPTLALTTTTNNDTVDTWQVQYARFFNCPPTSSAHHPSLVPQMKRIKGTWLSLSLDSECDFATIVMHLMTQTLRIDSVSCNRNESFQEEHDISKLNFTWPHVACLSGFPARGSKVVFMSYKDRVGQIHKFAVRFATLYETERFINSVKEFFGHEKIDGSMSGISITRTSSQSEIIPRAPQDWDPISSSANFPQPMYRAPQDWDPISSSADVSQPIYRPPQNEDLVNSSADFSQPMYRWV
nr:hypothetical protein [Tanacetum cinerariifolium]